MDIWAIIPAIPQHTARSRLAGVLSKAERTELTLQLATHTASIADQVRNISNIMMISRDEPVLQMARQRDYYTHKANANNLNEALTGGVRKARKLGAKNFVILPSNLPRLSINDVVTLVSADSPVAIVPDRKFIGTNALYLRGISSYTFRFGDDAFAGHLGEAAKLGHVAQVVYADTIEFDLRTPADWLEYQRLAAAET